MGRSQVLRNKTHGRPGQGRGARDAGKGRHSQVSSNVAGLGGNSFRYDNDTAVGDKSNDGDYYGLLDVITFSGDYYSLDYRIDGGDFEDNSFGVMIKNVDTATDNSNDYLFIDIAGLSKGLEQLPIHERLDLPMHIGKHLGDMYGGGRKKTLAELRENSKVTSGSTETSSALAVEKMSLGSVTENDEEPQRNEGAHDDKEDLEAWLDNMIS